MAVAFKEWYAVCEALGNGVQDVILRKGGIHEGRAGFKFEHREFYLFPTLFHKQSELLKHEAMQWAPVTGKKVWDLGEEVILKYHCRIEVVEELRDWELVKELDARHVYTEELVRERFEWEGKGMATGCIQVAHVKVQRLDEPLVVHYQKSHGGCRSWIEV